MMRYHTTNIYKWSWQRVNEWEIVKPNSAKLLRCKKLTTKESCKLHACIMIIWIMNGYTIRNRFVCSFKTNYFDWNKWRWLVHPANFIILSASSCGCMATSCSFPDDAFSHSKFETLYQEIWSIRFDPWFFLLTCHESVHFHEWNAANHVTIM